MIDRSLSQGLPDDRGRGGHAAREAYRDAGRFRAATADGYSAAHARTAMRDTGGPTAVRHPAAREAADRTGFLGALFDFGFTSFVTPKVVKVLYALLMIGTVVSALAFTIIVFKVSTAFGILTLVFGDPLIILIVMAIYRMILEFFVVTFRVAEGIQALQERGEAD
jgi:Domain of unknown function (DUF4282)